MRIKPGPIRITLLLLAFLLGNAVQAQQTGGQGARGRTGGIGAAGTREYPAAGTVGEAIITSDPETRRIIVITDEETSQYVSQVITNLDQPRPQVLINVVFLEVTYAHNFDLGIESSYGHRIDGNTTIGATNIFGGLLGQGAVNPWNVPGAGLYTIAGKEFTATLRAISENGKLEVVSRPTILARNNQQAYILVGQQVPLISNVRFTEIGGQINTVTYQDVGVILRVTPFITSEGYVEMIVAPEISALDSSRGVPISTDASGGGTVFAPLINKRAADTVVVTPNGQTVVIGGLMENNKTETDSKIPILGDIPGLGNLFKRRSKGSTKTELIIFLTPHIVRDPMQLAGASQRETDKAIYAPNALTEDELNRFLEGVPLKRTPEKKR